LYVDEATLRRLHRRHMLSIPFENLDQVQRVPVSTDPAAVFAKIVGGGRGGWCFEQNGLFCEALRAVGFRVDAVGATVGQPLPGELNHLALVVHLAEPWLADVGFGFGPLEPLLLREGETRYAAATFRLSRRAELWTFEMSNEGPGYVFTTRPRERGEFEPANRRLQVDADSPFVNRAFVARALEDGYHAVRDNEFLRWTRGELAQRFTLDDPSEMRRILSERFGLPDALRSTGSAE
jgi:N-hydroxyarylamine O-acetyltransferase